MPRSSGASSSARIARRRRRRRRGTTSVRGGERPRAPAAGRSSRSSCCPRWRTAPAAARRARESAAIGGLERVDAHPLLAVDRDGAHRAGAQPEHVRRAPDHDVRLGRRVQRDRTRGRHAVLAHVGAQPGVARALERDEVRHRAAGHDHPAGPVGQPEALGQPARQVQLDLRRARTEPVAAQVRVQAGGEHLGRGRGHRAGADDVGEEGRVAGVDGMLEGQRAQMGEQRVRRQRLLGHRQRERRRDLRGRRRHGSPAARGAARAARPTARRPPPRTPRARSGSQARSVTGAGGEAIAPTLSERHAGSAPAVTAGRDSAASWRAGSRRACGCASRRRARGGRARTGSRRGRSRSRGDPVAGLQPARERKRGGELARGRPITSASERPTCSIPMAPSLRPTVWRQRQRSDTSWKIVPSRSTTKCAQTPGPLAELDVGRVGRERVVGRGEVVPAV